MHSVHSLSRWLTVAGLVLAIGATSRCDAEEHLSDAVREFNQRASEDEIGSKEPTVTVAEVVAAIRSWDREKFPVTDEVYDTFQGIAETQILPDGAELSSCTGLQSRGYYYDVWWVDLTIRTGTTTGYTYRIRARMLNSRRQADPGGSLRVRGEFIPLTPDPTSEQDDGSAAGRGSDPGPRDQAN